jgi:hypothetical protein
MSKVSRADWAASVPWAGITDKPVVTPGVTDIGQLTGNGFANGKVPIWSSASGKFVPGSLPTPTPTPPPTPSGSSLLVYWDVPLLHALQSAWEDFTFSGVSVSRAISLGAPFADEFIQISASTPAADTVRITVTNLGLADVDLGGGTWELKL